MVFIWTKVSGALIEALPNLRLILTMSTGYDHIDLQACRARDYRVHSLTTARTPSRNTPSH